LPPIPIASPSELTQNNLPRSSNPSPVAAATRNVAEIHVTPVSRPVSGQVFQPPVHRRPATATLTEREENANQTSYLTPPSRIAFAMAEGDSYAPILSNHANLLTFKDSQRF